MIRWNLIINMVNNERPIEALDPPANAEEARIFNRMVGELAAARAARPEAAFAPVEKE